MTILADEITILVDRFQLFTYVLTQAVFVVTLGAGGDGHIRLQAAQRRGFGNVDMAGSAFRHVLFAGVSELHRETVQRVDSYLRFVRKLVTAATVIVDGWL